MAPRGHIALLVAGAAVAFAFSAAPCAKADYAAPVVTIDLDAAPETRWVEATKLVVQKHGWNATYGAILTYMDSLVPPFLQQLLSPVFEDLLAAMPGEYADEIRGFHSTISALQPPGTNLTLGMCTAMNLLYEITAGCTSIVARAKNNTVYHARNLDYPIAGLNYITVQANFVKGGALAYQGTAFVGYTGLLTGMRKGAFAISIDERHVVGVNILTALIENLESALQHGRSIGFFIRDTLAAQAAVPTFAEAVQVLNTTRLVAPMYLIVSGVQPMDGAVITRNRTHADDSHGTAMGVRTLQGEAGRTGRHFTLETNYDAWNAPPKSDDRRDPALKMMDALQAAGTIGPTSMFKVVSTPPVLNEGTRYTTVMSAKEGLYQVTVREDDNVKGERRA